MPATWQTNPVFAGANTVPNRMGGLMSAGGGGSYASELFPTYKNRFRDGAWASGVTLDLTGWPTNSHSVDLSTATVLPPWASGTFKCGFIGTATTPTARNNCAVSNIVLGNGTSTYTTFDLIASAAGFGFNVASAAKDHFAYLPAYPGSATDDPTNPNSITPEAIALYGGMRHIRTEWDGIALWNSQLMTAANRNTAANTQAQVETTGWFGNQVATLGGLPGSGATSGTLSGWTRGAGVWCITFQEAGPTFEGRICTVGSGANPTITWTRPLVAAVTSTTAHYGTEGYPLERMLALAVAANTSLVVCEANLQDGTNFVAGSYTAARLALIHTYMNNYPSWTGTVYLTPGNENWNGNYNSYRIFQDAYQIGGFASSQTYAGEWMHALAQLGRAEFGSLWGTRVGGILEWQDAQPGQFYSTLNYMVGQGYTPNADIQYIATAPYMNPAVSPTSGSGGTQPTIANIVAAVAASAATQPAVSKLENVVIMGMHYGIPHMTYESGPQWNGGSYSGVTNLAAAIMDPSYVAPIVAYYNGLQNSGSQVFTHNTLGVPAVLTGGTGAANELGNIYPVTRANTPNWEALMQIALSNPNLFRNLINGPGSIILGGNYADQTGAANPGFPSGTFSTTNGSPRYASQGYIGYFFNCTYVYSYSLILTMAGTGTPATNVEVGSLSGFTIPISGFTLAAGANSVGTVTIPVGPGYILFGNGTPQTTLTIASHRYN